MVQRTVAALLVVVEISRELEQFQRQMTKKVVESHIEVNDFNFVQRKLEIPSLRNLLIMSLFVCLFDVGFSIQ